MANDLKNTIKGDRKSHLSLDDEGNAEFHLRKDELSIAPVQGGKYYVQYPVTCVSDYEKGKSSNGEDVDMCRFTKDDKPDIVTRSGGKTNPQDKLRGIAKRSFNAKGDK